MRIAANTLYNNLLESLQNNQNKYRQTQIIATTEQQVFKPSDDPLGVTLTTDYRSQHEAYQKYIDNLDSAQNVLTITDQALDGMYQLINKAIDAGQIVATETSTVQDKLIASDEVNSLINQAIEIMNTNFNGRYIFSGTDTNTPTYSNVGRILAPYSAPENLYNGTVNASGDFTGTTNKEYQVKISGAGMLGEAKYQVSDDGGQSWNTEQLLTAQVNIGDGIKLDFEDKEFAVDDSFKVQTGAGRHQGNSDKIEFQVSRSSTMQVNMTAGELLERDNFFDYMHNLKNAMLHNNTFEISEGLADLREISKNIQTNSVKSGTNLNRVEISKSNLETLSASLLASIKDIEAPDMYEILSQLTRQETALTASVTLMSKIFPQSLINYLS